MKILQKEKTVLTEAVTYFMGQLYEKFPGIQIRSVTPYEDEEFCLEVLVPSKIDTEEVEVYSLKECIYLEDHYDVYILAKVSKLEG